MRQPLAPAVVHRGVAAASFLLLAGITLTACGGGSPAAAPSGTVSAATPNPSGSGSRVPGVTATTITIGSHQPLSGIQSSGYAQIAPAAKAYFAYVNARGGVNGRKIDYRFQDDQSLPIRAKSVVKSYLDANNVFAVFNGLVSTDHAAVSSDLANAGVPDLFVGGGCGCWNAPTTLPLTFGFEPDVVAEGKILAAQMMARFPGASIGVLYQNDAYGLGGLQGIRTVVPPALLVDTESYSTTNGSLATQVGALRAKQAAVVISFSIPVFTSELLLTAADLGYQPTFAVSRGGSEPTAVAGEAAKQTANNVEPKTVSVLDGVTTDSFLPAPDDIANPWIALFRSIHAADDTISDQPFTGDTVYGMAAAQAFVEAIRAAGPALTRTSLVATLEATTLSATGPALTPVTLSTTNHGGFAGMRIGTIESGSLVLAGPVLTTDLGAGPVTALPAAAPAIPAFLTVPPTGTVSATASSSASNPASLRPS
jgi:ABC-type branched-subunit amino acid transport system substrate-binding protein